MEQVRLCTTVITPLMPLCAHSYGNQLQSVQVVALLRQTYAIYNSHKQFNGQWYRLCTIVVAPHRLALPCCTGFVGAPLGFVCDFGDVCTILTVHAAAITHTFTALQPRDATSWRQASALQMMTQCLRILGPQGRCQPTCMTMRMSPTALIPAGQLRLRLAYPLRAFGDVSWAVPIWDSLTDSRCPHAAPGAAEHMAQPPRCRHWLCACVVCKLSTSG
jgi:hypothetical protein